MLRLLLIDRCRGLCPRLPMRKGRWIRGTGRPVCVLVRQLDQAGGVWADRVVH